MPERSFKNISFYIVAHADDWQLFMQPNAYRDLVASDNKVVFIITTAGDAGNDDLFFAAREEGAKSSIRFCLAPLGDITESTGTKNFNDQILNYWSVNNALCYFFRLPDGNLGGEGFPAYNYQSLRRFREGTINCLTATDKSATYSSWEHFCNTIRSVIEYEALGLSEVSVHYLNPDINENPGEHQDHIATGLAMQNIANNLKLQQVLYTGYSVNNHDTKLQGDELFWKLGMFAAYEKAVYDGSGYSTLKESVATYLQWSLSGASFIKKSFSS